MIGNKKQAINYLLNYTDDKKFEVKEYKPKRGLRANAYYWSLVNELATEVRLSKEDIHLQMLKDYGKGIMTAISSNIEPGNYFKYYSDEGEATINGVKVRKVKVYKPSSEMDSKEFSILLDGLIQECKQLDIPTLDEAELEGMMKEYEKVFNSKQSR